MPVPGGLRKQALLQATPSPLAKIGIAFLVNMECEQMNVTIEADTAR